MNDDGYSDCKECKSASEQHRCTICGMTGHEIYLARFEAKTGERHIWRDLEDLTNWR